MDNSRRKDVASVIVRLVMLGLSVVSWVVTLVGVVRIYQNIEKNADDNGKLVVIQSAFTLPYVLLLVGAVPYGLLTLTHIIYQYRSKNRAHIIHSIMMAYYILFIAAGGAGIFVGVAYILGGDISQNILRMDLESMKLALGGTVFTLIFQWISSFIWPLFNYERHPHRIDYQELEESTNFR
ncbi:uncharacterized protein LOC135350459 isoform X2 [Halichondria panicea]|uniref:uncharacterized protein LOC135350459 isoform X2 n=1 Tax=Halichondria panicea TaxID=6063 RepID=UPI00312B6C21